MAGAARAIEVLKAGGKYRLVLRKSLTSQKIAKRGDALLEKAEELGISLGADSIEILTADALAQWVGKGRHLASGQN